MTGVSVTSLGLGSSTTPAATAYKEWMLGPFIKQDEVNPILGADFDSQFFCPARKKLVRWEARAILGAAAIVKEGKLCLIYHAEDTSEGYAGLRGSLGTFREGYAESKDGMNFQRHSEPVIYPAEDFMKDAEWLGGCEIPRIVEGPDGAYYLYYSALNRQHQVTLLSVATSKDLLRWEKHGLAFGKAYDGQYRRLMSKAGAVVTKLEKGRLVATRIKGKYWMYWGTSDIFVAVSEDLIEWTPLKLSGSNPALETRFVDPILTASNEETKDLMVVQGPRNGRFDSEIVEGGVAVLTRNGIVHIYNACDFNSPQALFGRKKSAVRGTPLTFGQALYDAGDPTRLLDRSDTPFLRPDREYEMSGCTPMVIYCTGLAYFAGKWWLYYNGADWVVSVATAEASAAQLTANR
jgi:predicted GH43/DUF377 family glycosyl hydrolase